MLFRSGDSVVGTFYTSVEASKAARILAGWTGGCGDHGRRVGPKSRKCVDGGYVHTHRGGSKPSGGVRFGDFEEKGDIDNVGDTGEWERRK